MGGGNMQQIMRQAQKMQQKLAEKTEQLNERVYSASSGGGAVSARVSGKREVLSLTIKPEAIDPDDVEMLQDLIISAINEALRLGETVRENEINSLGGGMGGLF
jgi:DNA-binding YbaB/EbfC family protein